MKNYWKLDSLSLFTVPYVYVDHNSYLADNLFIQRKIVMKFKEEMARVDSPYCIIFCKVLKRDAQKLEDALEKLNLKSSITCLFKYDGSLSALFGLLIYLKLFL